MGISVENYVRMAAGQPNFQPAFDAFTPVLQLSDIQQPY